MNSRELVIYICLGVFVVCGASPTALAFRDMAPSKKKDENAKSIVARVNGKEITMASLREAINKIRGKHMMSGGALPEKDETEIRKEALDSLIFFELAHESAQKKVKVSEEKIDNVLKKLKENLKTDQAFRDYLAREGYTEATLKAEIERRLLVEEIIAREVDAKAHFDEDSARAQYESQKDNRFTISEKVEVDELILPAGEDRKLSKERAETLRRFLVEEKSSANARKFYPDIFVQSFLVYKDKNPDVFEMLEGLKPLEPSNVKEKTEGFHIFFVRKRIQKEVIPFERVKYLFVESARQRRMSEWYEELKKNAKIEILPDTEGKKGKNAVSGK